MHALAAQVTEVNEALAEKPGLVNEDALGEGWFIKVAFDGAVPDTLMDDPAYITHCEEELH